MINRNSCTPFVLQLECWGSLKGVRNQDMVKKTSQPSLTKILVLQPYLSMKKTIWDLSYCNRREASIYRSTWSRSSLPSDKGAPSEYRKNNTRLRENLQTDKNLDGGDSRFVCSQVAFSESTAKTEKCCKVLSKKLLAKTNWFHRNLSSENLPQRKLHIRYKIKQLWSMDLSDKDPLRPPTRQPLWSIWEERKQ